MNRNWIRHALLAASLLASPFALAQQSDNRALLCNGTSDYLAARTLVNTANDFTIEAWINPIESHEIDVQSIEGCAGITGQHYVVYPVHGTYCWGNGHAGVGISAGINGVSVYEHAGNYLPAVLVYEGTIEGWTHVAVVYSDRTPSLYINGRLVKTGLRSPQEFVHPTAGMSPTYTPLGGIGGGNYGHFKGLIDDVHIWNSPLDQRQIKSDMKSNLTGNEPNLVLNLDMNRSGMGAGLELASTVVKRQASVQGIAPVAAVTYGTATTPVFVTRPSAKPRPGENVLVPDMSAGFDRQSINSLGLSTPLSPILPSLEIPARPADPNVPSIR